MRTMVRQENELLQIIKDLQDEFRAEQDLLLAKYADSVKRHEERLARLQRIIEEKRILND